MKPFYLLMLFIATSIFASAQIDGGFSYSMSLPRHEMKQNIRPVHSLNAIFISPVKNISKLSWGIEAGFGTYAFLPKTRISGFPMERESKQKSAIAAM